MIRAAGKFGPYGGSHGSHDDVAPLLGPLAAPALRLAAVDLVRARVAVSISLGLLAPGQRLPDPEIVAAALDVSLITVRRAFESLCHDGLLDRRRGRTGGTFVADRVDLASVEKVGGHDDVLAEITALVGRRTIVECGTIALVVAASPAEAALAALADSARALLAPLAPSALPPQAPAPSSLAAVELAFHSHVAELSAVPGAADQIRAEIGRVAAYLPPADVCDVRRAVDDHVEILAAVCLGDVCRAVELTRRHVERVHRLEHAAAPTS